MRGQLCSISGGNYEKQIHNVLKKCFINGSPFHTQSENELGGSSSKNDIVCNFNSIYDIGIEVKKYKTPDWMQCSIRYNEPDKQWSASIMGKNTDGTRHIFNNILSGIYLFDGQIPIFYEKKITHDEWVEIKKESRTWNDYYMNIPNDTIRRLYHEKGCQYIQISDGFGLYHLGEDVCNFGVPIFEVEQQMRVRTKIHTRKDKDGYCNLSVTVACQPKNINFLPRSLYSLDDENRLPPILSYASPDNNNF
jgi:hypothetical protein